MSGSGVGVTLALFPLLRPLSGLPDEAVHG